jgi:hypothetical protein
MMYLLGQAGVERLLRAGFMCTLFAGLFGTGHWKLHTIRRTHIIVLRLLGCQVQNLSCGQASIAAC